MGYMSFTDQLEKKRAELGVLEKVEHIVHFVNVHAGSEMLLRTTKRTTGKPRIFRFEHLSSSGFDALSKGLMPVVDLDRDGATRHMNLYDAQYVKRSDESAGINFLTGETWGATPEHTKWADSVRNPFIATGVGGQPDDAPF